MPTVVLVGTLDTKGEEYAFLADRIREQGVDVILVDAGIVGAPLATPDVTREEVAAAVGADVAGARRGGRPWRGRRDDVAWRRRGREASPRGWQARRGRGARRLGRLVARHLRDATAADRRPEADGLDRRLGRHEPVRRLGRRDDDVLGRRHRRGSTRCRRGSWRTPRRRSRAWRRRPCRRSARSSRSSPPRCSASRRPRSRRRASGSRSSATRCSSSIRRVPAAARWRR